MTHKLTCPAPRRASVRTEDGFVDVPYTLRDVHLTKSGGGYFLPTYHDFANDGARKAALGKQPVEVKHEDE